MTAISLSKKRIAAGIGLVIGLVGIIPAGVLEGQEPREPETFTALRFQFHVDRAKLDRPQLELAEQYRQNLLRLEEGVPEGDTGKRLQIRAELNGLETGNSEPAKGFPELERLQKVFRAESQKLQKKRKAELETLAGTYRARLQGLVSDVNSGSPEARRIGRELKRLADPEYRYLDRIAGRSKDDHYRDSRGNRVFLPMGGRAFADVSVTHGFGTKPPIQPARDPDAVLGAPDFGTAAERVHSLGCGGHGIWQFTDNTLEDGPGDDLHIFEVGPSIEAVGISISTDGSEWIDVGRVEGRKAAIDIGPKVKPDQVFHYVRVTDLESNCGEQTPGADLDAIAAINGKPIGQAGATDWLDGTRWRVTRTDDSFDITIEKGHAKHSGWPETWPYRIDSEGVVKYRSLNFDIELRFDDDRQGGRYRDHRGVEGTLRRLP